MPLQDPGAAAADESNATKTATTATAAAPVASTRTRLREKRLTINQNSSDGRDQHANWHQIEKTPAPGTRRPVPSVPVWYPAPASAGRPRSGTTPRLSGAADPIKCLIRTTTRPEHDPSRPFVSAGKEEPLPAASPVDDRRERPRHRRRRSHPDRVAEAEAHSVGAVG